MLNKEIKTILKIFFILYLIGLIIILDLKVTEPQMVIIHLREEINWFQGEILIQPFEIIKKYANLAQSWDDWFVKNLVGNICLFMPFGFILPIIKKKKGFLRIFFWGVLFALLLESSQFVFGIGKADIDDIFLYSLGVCLGYIIYLVLKKRGHRVWSKLLRIKGIILANLLSVKERDKELWVFGAWFGTKYSDNSKYLFQEALNNKINAVWITKKKQVYEKLCNQGLPVEMSTSRKGKKVQKKAGYAIWVTDYSDFEEDYLGGTCWISLGHGVSLKKIADDDYITNKSSRWKRAIKKNIKKFPRKKVYAVATSDQCKKNVESAYGIGKDRIINSGLPRNDIFFKEYNDEYNFSFINGRKTIVYMPTHRDEGRKIIDIPNILDLDRINDICKTQGYLLIIKKHFYHRHEQKNYGDYSNIIEMTSEEIDTQELLKHTDVLITDYSSVYIDYLLLDRPIIFYNYDMKNYLMNDREMYFDYSDVTPGPIIKEKGELTEQIRKICEGENDEFKGERERVRKIFFENHRGVCGKELIDKIKEL